MSIGRKTWAAGRQVPDPDDPHNWVPPVTTGVVLQDPEQVTVEIATSPITGRTLLRIVSAVGTVEQEQFWAEGIQELVVDLGREDLLVFRPGEPPTRRSRPS